MEHLIEIPGHEALIPNQSYGYRSSIKRDSAEIQVYNILLLSRYMEPNFLEMKDYVSNVARASMQDYYETRNQYNDSTYHSQLEHLLLSIPVDKRKKMADMDDDIQKMIAAKIPDSAFDESKRTSYIVMRYGTLPLQYLVEIPQDIKSKGTGSDESHDTESDTFSLMRSKKPRVMKSSMPYNAHSLDWYNFAMQDETLKKDGFGFQGIIFLTLRDGDLPDRTTVDLFLTNNSGPSNIVSINGKYDKKMATYLDLLYNTFSGKDNITYLLNTSVPAMDYMAATIFSVLSNHNSGILDFRATRIPKLPSDSIN